MPNEHANEHADEIEVFINTNPRSVPKGDISHADVVRLEYGVTGEEAQGYSVTYERGPEGKEEGILPFGGSVKAKKGMRFDVFPTGRS